MNKIISNHLDLNIIKTCNMSCTYCDHFSSLYKMSDTYPYEPVIEDIKKLSDFYFCDKLWILGGEPLLHPDLKTIIKEIKKTKISNKIGLFTNGVLIDKIDDELISLIDEVNLSKYPKKIDEAKIFDLGTELSSKNKTFNVRDIDVFQKAWNPIDKNYEAMEETYLKCGYVHTSRCHSYSDGYFYKCSPAFHINKIQKNEFADGIKINDSSFEIKFKNYMKINSPHIACKNCDGRGKRYTWDETPNKQMWLEKNNITQ